MACLYPGAAGVSGGLHEPHAQQLGRDRKTPEAMSFVWDTECLPSGKLRVGYEQRPFIVDIPIKQKVIFHSYVSLPEGKSLKKGWFMMFVSMMVMSCR